jgi:hypothetical protein
MESTKPTLIKEEDIIDSLMNKEEVQRLEHIIATDSQRMQDLVNLLGYKASKSEPKQKLADTKKEFPEIKKEVDHFLGVKWIRTPYIEHVPRISHLHNEWKKKKSVRKQVKQSAGLMFWGGIFELASIELPELLHLRPDNFLSSALSSIALGAGIGAVLRIYPVLKYELGINYESANEYDPLNERIMTTKHKRAHQLSILAHEYAHHVQARKNMFAKRGDYNSFKEGHARGVERHVALEYFSKESNPAFAYEFMNNHHLPEMKIMYSWLAKKQSLPVNESLLKTRKSYGKTRMLLESQKPTAHSIGNAFFYTQEMIQGKGIYRDVIRGEFQVL